jgi:hypothetical protein
MINKKMIKKLKNLLREKDIKLILFGETHGFLDDASIQSIVIDEFKPSIFLYEMLEETELLTESDKKKFLEEEDDTAFSVISNFGELKKTVELAKEKNLPIKGMDIKNMCRKNKNFLKKLNLTPNEIKREEEILLKREQKQVNEIVSSLNDGKKIFASTGTFHLREDSPLLNIGEKFIIIYPSYQGEQIIGPTENMELEKIRFEVREISPDV